MSRKSALQTLTASGLFNTTPSPHNSSSLISEKSTPINPYILQEETIPGKTPYTRRHHGKSSGLVSGSKGGGGKDGRNGGKNGNGGNQGQSDNGSESSSSPDDEDEDDDEEADEEDEEEPAVSGPVRVNDDDNDETAMVDKLLGHPARATASIVKESLKRGDDRTGSNLKKRSFSMATDNDERKNDADFDAEDETGDESDYPRKRIATELSNTNGILAYHSAPPSVVTTDTTPYDLADLDDLDDLDDEDILDDEESALIQEFEANGCDTPVDLSVPNAVFREYGDEDPTDPNLITAEELEDLDNEVFGVGWGDPSAFHDISLANDFTSFSDPFADVQLDYGLFPESISEMSGAEFSTPFDTPNYTPRGSFSGIFSEPNTPDNSTESDDDDDFDQSGESAPFFERNDPMLKHVVNTIGEGGWADDSDEEHGLPWKHFFSKGEVNGGQSEEDSETDEGETTDEEEDLPMPTPQSRSMLRRASVSSVSSSRPQVVHIDNTSGGPTVASWVADPNRTICVIDGSKKTFLLPGASRGYEFNTGGTDISQLMLEESESEKSTGQMGYNPTLGGLAGVDGLFLNGIDIGGPQDALYDSFDFDGIFDLGDLDVDGDLVTNDDEIDEFEHDLQITDFLDFSTDDADGETHDDNSDDNTDGGENDECVGAVENSETMLARWEQVTVTSFRKRQVQHSQGDNFSNNPATSHRICDRRLSQTITPARRKKIKPRYMINNKGPGSSSGIKKAASNKKSGSNIGVGAQWGLIDI